MLTERFNMILTLNSFMPNLECAVPLNALDDHLALANEF